MNRWQAWLMHAANVLVGGTGIVYGVMIYFMTSNDPYSVVNHPWQPHLQHVHIFFAPLLVFTAGLIWQRHVIAMYKSTVRSGRWSGIGLIASLVPMIASGYLLQTNTDEGWHQTWIVVHVAASTIWVVGYLAHQVKAILFAKRFRVREPGLNVMPGPDELG